jgi:hypothetical protein
MTGDNYTSGNGGRSRNSGNDELHRLLIEDFYQDSVGRYGKDSDQACMLARWLNPGGGGPKSD